jgi:hypothetical protein
MTDGRAVHSYKETRVYVTRDAAAQRAGGVRPKRKENTTKAARIGMWLQNWMEECGRGRREGIG